MKAAAFRIADADYGAVVERKARKPHRCAGKVEVPEREWVDVEVEYVDSWTKETKSETRRVQRDVGRKIVRDRALGCSVTIAPGDRYVEVLWEAPPYGSGSRYCAACAVAHLRPWVLGPVETDAPTLDEALLAGAVALEANDPRRPLEVSSAALADAAHDYLVGLVDLPAYDVWADLDRIAREVLDVISDGALRTLRVEVFRRRYRAAVGDGA